MKTYIYEGIIIVIDAVITAGQKVPGGIQEISHTVNPYTFF